MIEYLHNAIRATAGQDIDIIARITDESGMVITDNCHLMLFDDEELLATVDGELFGEEFIFLIPADVTKGLCGRFWYCICHEDINLCFKEPIYLI